MKLLIGLGNPGERYKNNRHNAGYVLVDRVQSREFGGASPGFLVKKTDVFVNDSGKFVKQMLDYYRLQTPGLYIVHDDLDLPLGQYKIQKGIGPKLHYGIQSIEQALGTKDFWRIRIGVDNRDSQNRTAGEEYVLQDFTDSELKTLEKVVNEILDNLKFTI